VGRLQREIENQIERKASTIWVAVQEALGQTIHETINATLNKVKRIWAQSARRKTMGGQPKLYSWHAPEVDCISKGKARTPYEFGTKVGIASTLKGNLIVGVKAFHGNPYDGHTLHAQLEQATILMQDTHHQPATAFVDLGYRGVDAENPDVRIVHRGKSKRITEQERQLLKLRQAIEPIIGHLKADHRMDRCPLKGETGDKLHAVLCAAGYNIQWLLRMIAKKGVTFLSKLYLRLQKLGCLASLNVLNGFKPAKNKLTWA
jgi:IS5 family transposase